MSSASCLSSSKRSVTPSTAPARRSSRVAIAPAKLKGASSVSASSQCRLRSAHEVDVAHDEPDHPWCLGDGRQGRQARGAFDEGQHTDPASVLCKCATASPDSALASITPWHGASHASHARHPASESAGLTRTTIGTASAQARPLTLDRLPGRPPCRQAARCLPSRARWRRHRFAPLSRSAPGGCRGRTGTFAPAHSAR